MSTTPGQPLSFWLLAIRVIRPQATQWEGRQVDLPGYTAEMAADVVEGSLAPSTCSTSFQDHARRTPGEWRDSYGIPSRRRSNDGLIKGQGVVRDTVRVSISFMKGVGLYFFYIACVTLHPLPCLQLFIAELLPYELIRVSHVVHCTTAAFVCKTFKI